MKQKQYLMHYKPIVMDCPSAVLALAADNDDEAKEIANRAFARIKSHHDCSFEELFNLTDNYKVKWQPQ